MTGQKDNIHPPVEPTRRPFSLEVPSLGHRLEATLIYPEGRNITGEGILFVHGWKGSQTGYIPRAETLAREGFIGLTFSMSGHGRSDGDIESLTRRDFLEDVVAAHDALSSQPEVDRISVVGVSFGGYLSTLLTSRRPVERLVLRAPANYPNNGFNDVPQVNFTREQEAEAVLNSWRRQSMDHDQTVSLDALYGFPGDVLIVESEHDDDIPPQTLKNYAVAVTDQSKLTFVTMKGADHDLRTELSRQMFIQILVDWFTKKPNF